MLMPSVQNDIAALAILSEEVRRISQAISRLTTEGDDGTWIAARKRRLQVVTAYVFIRMGITPEEMGRAFENTQYFYDHIVEGRDKGEATQKVG